MSSFFSNHRGEGFPAEDPAFNGISGPSLFAHQYRDMMMAGQRPLHRRPQPTLHLRGSLNKSTSRPSSAPAATHFTSSSTAPAASTAEAAHEDAGPAMTVEEVMRAVTARYDLDLSEYDYVEWLLTSGLVKTLGELEDLCAALKYPEKTVATTPLALRDSHETVATTSITLPHEMPTSWTQESTSRVQKVLPPLSEPFVPEPGDQSPEARPRAEQFRIDTSPGPSQANLRGTSPQRQPASRRLRSFILSLQEVFRNHLHPRLVSCGPRAVEVSVRQPCPCSRHLHSSGWQLPYQSPGLIPGLTTSGPPVPHRRLRSAMPSSHPATSASPASPRV